MYLFLLDCLVDKESSAERRLLCNLESVFLFYFIPLAYLWRSTNLLGFNSVGEFRGERNVGN